MTSENCVPLQSWPEDFQQLLLDFWTPYNEGVMPGWIPVHSRKVEPYRERAAPQWLQHWDAYDKAKGFHYALRISRGVEFPPLVLHGGYLVDGYHRLFAHVVNGKEHFAAIELQDIKPLNPQPEVKPCTVPNARKSSGRSTAKFPQQIGENVI